MLPMSFLRRTGGSIGARRIQADFHRGQNLSFATAWVHFHVRLDGFDFELQTRGGRGGWLAVPLFMLALVLLHVLPVRCHVIPFPVALLFLILLALLLLFVLFVVRKLDRGPAVAKLLKATHVLNLVKLDHRGADVRCRNFKAWLVLKNLTGL